MSTEAAARTSDGRRNAKDGLLSKLLGDVRNTRILRFAVGVTLASAIAYSFAWTLSFLMPVLLAVILAMPLPAPSLRAGLTNMINTLKAFAIGVVFTFFLLGYPQLYIPMLGLLLFYIYYLMNRGGSFWYVLMLILAVLILPLLANSSGGLALGFASGFVVTGWLTVLMVFLSYGLVPDPATDSANKIPASPGLLPGYSAPAAQSALKSTVVVLPLVTAFIIFEWGGQLMVLILAAIFSLSPTVTKSKEASLDMLKSTAIGGLAATVIYWMLVAVPEFYFFVVLMFLTSLLFAQVIFSAKPMAKYFGSAFVAMFILVNSSLGDEADFSSAFIFRLFYIASAMFYMFAALKVIEHYWPSPVIEPGSQ